MAKLQTIARQPRVSASPRQTSAGFLRAVSAIVWKDLAAELRSRELLSAMLVFSMLVILIFNFALELDIRTRQSITAGVLWSPSPSPARWDSTARWLGDRGCLDGLLLAVDRTAICSARS
jgi:heme exporter protein B